MKIFIVICFIFLWDVNCDDNIYRFDYTYYPDIGGSVKLHLVPEKWFRARQGCSAEGSLLAWPKNKALLNRMTAILKSHNVSRAFTGISAIFSKGDFSSVNGVPLAKISTIPWAKGEPNNENYDEDCLTIDRDGLFADTNCFVILPYMCYRQHERNLKKTQCGTVDTAYVYSNITKACYKLHTRRQNWYNAFQMCHAEGAHIVTVDSGDEKDVVKNVLVDNDEFGVVMCRNVYNMAAEIHAGYYSFWEEYGGHSVHGKLLAQFPGYSTGTYFRDPNFKGYCSTITRRTLFNRYLVKYNKCDNKLPFVCKKDPDSLLASGHRF